MKFFRWRLRNPQSIDFGTLLKESTFVINCIRLSKSQFFLPLELDAIQARVAAAAVP